MTTDPEASMGFDTEPRQVEGSYKARGNSPSMDRIDYENWNESNV